MKRLSSSRAKIVNMSSPSSVNNLNKNPRLVQLEDQLNSEKATLQAPLRNDYTILPNTKPKPERTPKVVKLSDQKLEEAREVIAATDYVHSVI